MTGAADKEVSVAETDILLGRLDAGSARRADALLGQLLGPAGQRLPLAALSQLQVQDLLWRTLPHAWDVPEAEQHEMAWALGDFFAAAGLGRYAAVCRDRVTHEILALWRRDRDAATAAVERAERDSGVLPPDLPTFAFGEVRGAEETRAYDGASRVLEDGIATGALDPALRGFRPAARRRLERYLAGESADFAGASPLAAVREERSGAWRASFGDVPAAYWDRALPRLAQAARVPTGAALSLAPAAALLEAAAEGVTLTDAGYLPTRLALSLDERFGWSQSYGLGRPRGEADVPPLGFLDEHLRRQRLLTKRGRHLTVSAAGRRAMADPGALWRAVTAPRPRWRPGFEHDALAVLAVSLLGEERLSSEAVRAEMAYVLGGKWRAEGGATLDDGVWWVEVEWYRLGLVLGWFDDRRHPDELRLSGLGRAAAAAVFEVVAAGPRRR